MGSIHLGVDCGTQGVKAIALCADTSAVLAAARRPLDLLPGLPPGAAEQRPEDWWEAVCSVLAEVCGQLGAERARVASIGVSGQQHGLVALDQADRVIRPAKLWCDTSTSPEAREILDALGGLEGAVATLGNGIPPGFTISKLLWLKRREPENYERLRTLLLPHDFINFRLTGRKAMEHGDASGTALLDVRTRRWSRRAAETIGTEVLDMLPELVPPGEALGELRPELCAELDLPAGIAVSPGGGDNMMGAIGSGNVTSGIATISLGTSGTLYAYADEPIVDPAGEIAAFCDSTGGWLPLICTMGCTLALEYTSDLLGLDLAGLERSAERAPAGCAGLTLLPWFAGERTPNLPEASGVWIGLRRETMAPAHLARSAYEGAALGLAHGHARMRARGLRAAEIRVTGGGAASQLWLRILASVLDTPCVPLLRDEGAALGAALQGAWVAGRTRGDGPSLQALCERHVGLDEARREEPRAGDVAIYADALRLFERCAGDLGPAFALHRDSILAHDPRDTRDEEKR